jgi:CO/xanthine dehydrogenase Mo-binding subunit
MNPPRGLRNGIGQPVRRKEDFRLLTGRGRFGDDIVLPHQTQAGFSPADRPGQLCRRRRSAGVGACGDGALAARPCAHCLGK